MDLGSSGSASYQGSPPTSSAHADFRWQVADELLCHRLPTGHLPVRLIGMGVSGLDDTGQI